MLNIASGRRARTELASSARAPGAERIEDRSRRLVIPGTVGGNRLTGDSQFGTRSVIRFAESGACTRFDARGDRTRDQVRDRGTGCCYVAFVRESGDPGMAAQTRRRRRRRDRRRACSASPRSSNSIVGSLSSPSSLRCRHPRTTCLRAVLITEDLRRIYTTHEDLRIRGGQSAHGGPTWLSVILGADEGDPSQTYGSTRPAGSQEPGNPTPLAAGEARRPDRIAGVAQLIGLARTLIAAVSALLPAENSARAHSRYSAPLTSGVTSGLQGRS